MRLRCGPNLPHRVELESSRQVRKARKVLVTAKVGRTLRASRPAPRSNCQNTVWKSSALAGARAASPAYLKAVVEWVETPICSKPSANAPGEMNRAERVDRVEACGAKSGEWGEPEARRPPEDAGILPTMVARERDRPPKVGRVFRASHLLVHSTDNSFLGSDLRTTLPSGAIQASYHAAHSGFPSSSTR